MSVRWSPIVQALRAAAAEKLDDAIDAKLEQAVARRKARKAKKRARA